MTKRALRDAIRIILKNGDFDPSDINRSILKYRVERGKKQKSFLFNDILESAAFACDTSVKAIKSKSRDREPVLARFLIFLYYKENTIFSLSYIGKLLDRNHATVISGLKSINNDLDVRRPETLIAYQKFNQLIINL